MRKLLAEGMVASGHQEVGEFVKCLTGEKHQSDLQTPFCHTFYTLHLRNRAESNDTPHRLQKSKVSLMHVSCSSLVTDEGTGVLHLTACLARKNQGFHGSIVMSTDEIP